MVCPDDITMTVASGEDEIAVFWADPTPDDTPLMMESSRTNGSMFGVGRHAVLYTVDYTGGVSVMCFFYVIIRADDGRAGPNINRCPTSRTPQTYETFNNVNCSLPFDPPFVSQTMVTFTSTHTPQDTFEVGTYHVVYTFTNVQGFVSECVIPITVTQGSDVCRCFPCPNGETCNLVQGSTDSYTCVMQAGDLAPFIQNCPEDLEVILPNRMVSVSVDWIEPTASDDVDGVLDLVTNYSPRESFTLGITQVVYNATDSQQQSTFCVFNVEVSQTADTTSPVFVNCPSTVTHQLPIGEDTASVTWTEPSATDNDGQVTVDSTRSPGDNFTVGTSHVVYTATDEAGLQSTCDFNVRIKATEDHIPPVVSGCPFAAVAEISGTFTVVRWSIPTSADGSLVESPTLGSPGDFFPQGVLGPEYYIFNDTAGNIAACPLYIFVVDRSDTVGPTVSSCPSDVTDTVEPGIFTMAATWTPPSATDDVTSQGNIIQIATNDPGDSFGVGTTTVTYVFLDEQGNNGTCQFNVVVIQTDGDTVPPVFSGCPPNIDISAPFGATSTSVTWTEPTTSDSGFQLTVSSDNSPGANFPIGVTTVTYTATDMSGLNSQCTFNVIVRAGVVDNIRPVLTCPSFTPQIVELGTDTVELSFNDPEIMDESNTATLSHRSHNFPFNFSVSVATIVEFEAMDQAGNVGSCSFPVFFRGADRTPPTVMCPDPINRTVELGQGSINVSFPNANATDFSVVTLVSQSHTSGDAFFVGETNVTFVFQDEGANIGECSFPISVVAVDTTPPEVICPSIFYETVELGLNSTTIIFPNDTATATDSSGMPSLFSITPPSGSVFDIGQTLVTVVFTDMSNNLGNCTFTVNVSMQDTTPPMLICPETIIRETEIGQGPVNVSFDDPVISDASNTAMIVSRSHNSGVFFPAGAVTLVNFTAADESGNNASCSLAIFIMEVDRTDPVLSCPTNIIEEVELGVSTLTIPFDNPTIMDASNTAMITSSTHTSPWMFPVGETTTVSFDGRDESGNEGSCSLNVTVNTVDSTDPILVCPTDVNMTIELGPTEYEIPFLDAIVVDFAITTLSSSHTPPGPFPVGSTTVVTFTAIDQSGNQGNCSFSIDFNLVDTTGPTVTCPPSVTEIVESAQPAVVTFDNATATDLSGVVIFVSQSAQSGGVFPFGLSTVTFTFQDSSGNNGSCDISITVDTDQCLSSPCINGVCIDRVNSFECICDPGFDGPICDTADSTPPVVTCPTNIEQTVELGQPGPFQVTFDNATAIDTSGTVGLLNRSHDSDENFPIGQTVVTFVFGDVSGNFNNCSFLITINEVDETPPVPSCHDDIVDTVEPGVPGKRVTFDLVNATDNSGSATLVTHSPVSGSLFPVGSTSVIFLFTDMAGNQASCFFYVNITEADNLPPEAICPENVSGTAQPGSSYAAVDFTLPVATDNSGMVRLVSISSEPGSNFTVGTTVVTATFQDPAGNSDSCSFAVVVDGENSTVTVSDLGNDFFELTWTNDISMDIIAYTILLADTDGAVVERRSFAPSMTMIIQRFEQLTPGTQYTIDVDAVISSTMAMVNFAALSVVTRPKTAVNFTVYELSDSSYFFRWDPPALPDNFFIEYILRYNSSISSTEKVNLLPPKQSHGMGGLIPGSFYAFEFFTSIGPTLSTPSDVLRVPQGTQAVMAFRAVTAQEMEVSGTPPTDMTRIQLFSDDGLEEFERIVDPGITSSVFSNLRPDTIYTMIVISDDAVVSSDTRRTNLLDGISATIVTSDSVQLTWNEVGTATSYEISFISQDRTTAELDMSISAGQSMALVQNLQPQTLYTFSVVAVNGTTRNNVGSVTTATENANEPPVLSNCPNDTTAVLPDTSSFVSVTWTPPTATDDDGTPTVSSIPQQGSLFEYGLTYVTYTAMDTEALTANCSFTINVTDTTLPVINNCPGTVPALLIPGDSLVEVLWTEPTEGDNSGFVTLMSTHSPGAEFPLGETTVTYTAVDAAGNTMTCIFNVSVTPDPSNQPPVLSDCPMDLVVALPAASPTVNASWTPPNATDDNDIPRVSSTHQPGSAFEFGSTVVTYTATDSENLTDTCTFTVMVGDNTDPVLADCPVVESPVAQEGETSALAFWSPPTATDNSGMVTVSSNSNSGDSFPIESTIVEYTATDAAGNNVSCNFTIVVRAYPDDPIRPVDCPLGVNATLPMSSSQVAVSWTPPSVAGGNGQTLLTSDAQPNDLFRYGETRVTYTATDSDSFTSSCSFIVDVADVTDPVISGCPPQVTGEIPQGSINVSIPWTPPTAADNSGTVSLTSTRIPNDVFSVGTFEVIYTATDEAGNSADCIFQVVVTQASGGTPTSMFTSCPSNVIGTLPSTSPQVAVDWDVPMVNGTAVVSSDHQSGDMFGFGQTTVTYEARDSGVLVDTCSFVVQITDMIPPTFTGCPGSAIGVVPQGSTNVSVYWIPPMTEDNSGLVTLSSDRDPGDIFPVGSFPVVYTSRDMAGNSVSSCRFLVNVTMSTGEINAGPVLMNCPSDMTINLPVTSSEVAVSWTPPTADDDASTPIVTSDIQPGSMFGYGSTLVTYTAIDSQGVEDTCSFTVQVRDQTTPFIMDCPSSANGVLPQASSSDVPVFWTPPTHTDNSGMSTLRSTHIPGSSFREGTTEVLYTAVDVAGNLDECRFTVTVTSPEVVNPPPVILNCPSRRLGVLSDSSSVAVSWTEPTATDDTGTPTLTSNVRPGSDFRFGIATVTYTAEDDGGAIATCSFNVQVKDVTAPAITGCPASASATLLPGSTSVSVTWTPPTQTDNSGVSSLTSTHEPGSMFSAGDTEVTYTAIDTAGNTNQCSLVVTVILLSDVRCVTPAISTNLNSVGDQCSQPVEITFNAQCNYQCNSGYSIVGDTTLSCGMDGRLVGTFPTCQDTNECSASSPSCVDPNSFCLNTIGSFTCQCSDGYQSSMDGSCQRIQDESCSTVSCQNSGTCMEGTNGPVCQCGDTSTGPLCRIDLTCGATTCHSSQVCLNGQCVCPEGTRLVQGRCQDECAVSCDQFTERCVQTLSGLTCLCRPNRDRSYWTNACIERLQMFIISFAINRIGLQLVDFNDNYRNPQSLEYMTAASAVQNLLPRILVSQGVRGIINVGVVRFFQGSLMTEVSIPVGADFVGDASTISDAITAYLNSNDNTVSDGTHQLEIQPQVQAEETTVINECADVATNDCSSNSTCINDVSGVGYTCQCLQGLVDLYPTVLPGRHCVPVATDINECQTSTTCSDENSFCLNTVGSFVCVCDDGYEMTANGVCQVQVAQCSSTSCQNSGTCSVGTPEPVCTCSPSFAGAACEIDLRCGNGNCHLSQVCSNGLCTCPEGTELSLGICINQCSSSCDLQREICLQTSSGSYTCECRQDRDRSFWTRQCVTRVREFFIRFIVAEIGVLAVDYGDQYANEQSQEYQDAAEAIQNLLPRILLAQGVQGIINVGVQGFFPGSLGVDCRIPVSADFTGDENTILDAILSHLRNNGNTLSDGTFRLEIPGDLVTTRDAVATTVLPVQTGGVVSDGEVNIGLIVGVIGGVLLLICILSIGACLMFARTRQLNQLRRKGAVQSEEYGTDDLIYRLAASIPNVYFQSPGHIEEAPSPPSPPQENTPPAPQKEKRKHRRRKGPFFYHPA